MRNLLVANLVGSVPGKTQTDNSCSDKRELYTIAQALQKPYHDLLYAIKSAILRSQESALRATNKNLLALYYAIGKFVSINSRKGFWGQEALEAISRQLCQEMPGLRGFSERNLKNMRTFAESWEFPTAAEGVDHKDIIYSADTSAELHRHLPTQTQGTKVVNAAINPFGLLESV
ncbi:MAG: hypothetical protein II559_02185 [Muribaculaceae bacterium]|nr:hypothetical protein [Muribaculaceae bacterium]